MIFCKWCEKKQPLTEFYIGKKWAVQDKCKSCYKKAWAKKFQEVKVIHNIYCKNYYKNHPEAVRRRSKYFKEWYLKYKDTSFQAQT